MTNTSIYLTVIAIALLCTAASMPLVIWLARKWGVVDQPDARKVHVKAIPRVGGIAIAIVTIGTTLAALFWLYHREEIIPPELFNRVLTVLSAAAFIFLVGLVDDIRSVSPKFKAFALIAASLAVCGSGATIGTLYVSEKPWLDLVYFDWFLTVFWIASISIAINFIDGLDGLAGGIMLLACAVLAGFAMAAGSVTVALIPLALGGALIGFLIFNSHPARVFMGDSGSFFIGFVIATAMILANPFIGTLEAMLLPAIALSVPLTDMGVTMIRRRYVERRSMFAAERGHIHHSLLDQGLTQRQAVWALYGISILCIGIGMLTWLAEGWQTVGSLSMLVVVLWGGFRLAGSVRTREMLGAIRSRRHRDRQKGNYESAFHDLQLEFKNAEDFSSWWQMVCNAAEKLEFAYLALEIYGRDGDKRILSWEPMEPIDPSVSLLTAEIPVAERRRSEPLKARIGIAATSMPELSAERLTLFTRLMSDYSVAKLPTTMKVSGSDDVASHHGKREKPIVHQGQHDRPNGLIEEGPLAGKRVAIVHDFLYVYAGAEKVLEQILEVFPEADLFSLFDFLPKEQRGFLKGKPVKTTFIQNLPFASKKHRAYLPLMPLAIEQLDVSGYDVVISSSYLAAKGVITGPDQTHVCYCHSPARYAWDLQHQYLDQQRIGFSPKGIIARMILHYIRNWDARSALGVDQFIANSSFVAQRIKKLYRREAEVIHPPVDTEYYCPRDDGKLAEAEGEGDFYLAASRLVPYKRIDLIVRAFNRMPDKKLVVIGSGPDFNRIAAIAGPNVTMMGYQPNEELRRYMRLAKAFVFAAEEDFGIMPVEAMACGTPVIAYGQGGVKESVTDGQTGVFFDRQSPDALIAAVERFEGQRLDFASESIKAKFSQQRFRDEVEAVVMAEWASRHQDPSGAKPDIGGQTLPATKIESTQTSTFVSETQNAE